jgi:hypothetical protein
MRYKLGFKYNHEDKGFNIINERMIKMNEAKDMTIMNSRLAAFSYREAEANMAKKTVAAKDLKQSDFLCLENFPQSVDEVYSFGISLQNYLGDTYLALDAMNKTSKKLINKNLALGELTANEEIRRLANANLNQLLAHFYNNGGLINEAQASVSEQTAKEIRPFFNRIVINFLDQLDIVVSVAAKGNINAEELKELINNNVIKLYTTMTILFPVKEIQTAFTKLINIRKIVNN